MLADRRPPQAGDDLQLLLEPVEALATRRERDAVGGVLGVVPAGADAELDPAAAHVVDLGHGEASGPGRRKVAEVTRVPRRIAGRLPGEGAEGDPGVGRARAGRSRAPIFEVVVRAEEAVEAERLGRLGHGEQLLVGGALLGLGEDAQLHRPGR